MINLTKQREAVARYMASPKGKETKRKYKARHRREEAARLAAFRANPVLRTCSIKDCTERAERHHPNYDEKKNIVWLCRKHHLMVHGKTRKVCIVCGELQHAQELCKKHYSAKFRKQQGW